MHECAHGVAECLGRAVDGWLLYHAVPTSYPSLRSLVNRHQRMWVRVLRCRSRKNRLECSKVDLLAKVFRPRLRILHPWPNTRIAVNYLRQELRALAGLRGTAQGDRCNPVPSRTLSRRVHDKFVHGPRFQPARRSQKSSNLLLWTEQRKSERSHLRCNGNLMVMGTLNPRSLS